MMALFAVPGWFSHGQNQKGIRASRALAPDSSWPGYSITGSSYFPPRSYPASKWVRVYQHTGSPIVCLYNLLPPLENALVVTEPVLALPYTGSSFCRMLNTCAKLAASIYGITCRSTIKEFVASWHDLPAQLYSLVKNSHSWESVGHNTVLLRKSRNQPFFTVVYNASGGVSPIR